MLVLKSYYQNVPRKALYCLALEYPERYQRGFFFNLLDHIIVHGFQTYFLHPFFPSRTISRDLKKMKETIVTKLECMKTIPPPHRGQGTDPMTLYLPLIFSLSLQLHVHSAPSLLPRPALSRLPSQREDGYISWAHDVRPGRKCYLWGNSKIV